ncbi:MAG: HD domain-containing protein, partial [Candidatus Kerfeldbacteria bacterium]|nr:HD domain-containing protein [Candidatus Kerfeldbacteria bacterium]
MTSADELLRRAHERDIRLDDDLFRLAYEFTRDAHGDQKRLSGEPYFTHPVATAGILIDLGLDQSTVLAGLLHDVPEDTKISLKEVAKNFGDDVAQLVDGVTKLSAVKYRGVERYQESLRRMFLAMAKDIRV